MIPFFANFDNGHLLLGDCLEIAGSLPKRSLGLAYFDPPFFTQRRRTGKTPDATYDDRWPGDLQEYLTWLRPRLEQAIPLVQEHGSLVVHLDYHAVHYVKVLLDEMLGCQAFMNEIIWHYTGGGRSKSRFSCKHDTLLWYAPRGKPFFHLDRIRVPYKKSSGYARSGIVSKAGKQYLPHPAGTPMDDVWDIPIVNPMSHERVGYPTQKPLSLMKLIIAVLTNPGETVGDLMCGSGTTLVAADLLGRKWIGADCSQVALNCVCKRLTQP